MDGRPDQHRGRSLLALAVLVTAFIAGCGARETSPPLPSVTPPAGTVAPGPTASGSSAPAQPSPTSTTQDGTATTLLAAGDIGRCDSTHDDATGALAASLPGVVATLGDTAYEDGTTEELNDCFGGSWGPVKSRIRFAVTGNHDVHTDGGAPLRDYMGSAASRDGRTWFSEDLGAWHVIVLDGNCGAPGSHVQQRLGAGAVAPRGPRREQRHAARSRCCISRGSAAASTGTTARVGPLWDALYAAGADLVLDGHDHDYERFAPQDPDGKADAARGITEIVVGTGGAELEPFTDVRANSTVRIDDTYGVLELTLRADSWSFRFVGVDGTVHDQGTGTCH